MGALTPEHLSSLFRSPCLTYSAFLGIPPPTTLLPLAAALTRHSQLDDSPETSGLNFAMNELARRGRPAESSSLSYGLLFHLQLLPTPPHGDAVTFGYRCVTLT